MDLENVSAFYANIIWKKVLKKYAIKWRIPNYKETKTSDLKLANKLSYKKTCSFSTT